MSRTKSLIASIESAALLLALVTIPASAGAMTTPAEKCAAAKTKATGKAMSGVLKCQAAALKKGMKVDQACLQKVGDKLQDAFGKAEAGAACITTGDFPFLSALIDRFRQFIDVQLIPTFPTAVACKSAGASACDGTCPEGQFCRQTGVLCECVTPACGEIGGAPWCYGECPPEAPICANVNGTCQCTPGNTPCGQVMDDTFECNGACPAGQVCVPGEHGPAGEIGQECFCYPLTCGDGLYHHAPQCWGECPTDAPYCRDIAGFCQCTPSPN